MNFPTLRMGPAAPPTATAPRFWNVASVSDDEGEITLYGDVVSEQPYDWWTGEAIPGNYITPEGFMDDLATVKGKSKITVKLNSGGGDLYTGIAIHNALKALGSKVNVIVEGIAASAASVIMCAGDTVTVYPGSMVMIHGVSVRPWGSYNIPDLKLLIKGMEASEKAIAEIYSAKTGHATDKLRGWMTAETWMTGREAIEKGFANALKEGADDPTMSMSADKKVLYVNGVQLNIEGWRNMPGTIPVRNDAPPAEKPGANNRPAAETAIEGGNNPMPMTIDEMRQNHPEVVAQIEQAARTEALNQANTDAVAAERQRIADIDSIAASIPDQQMVNDAKYGANPCTAQELCFRVMQQSAKSGQQFLNAYQQDGKESGANDVSAAPNGGAPVNQAEQKAADTTELVSLYNKVKGGTK